MKDLIFETHAHYYDAAFDEDRDSLLRSLPESGIGTVINASAEPESLEKTRRLTEQWDFVYGAYGIHPENLGDFFRAAGDPSGNGCESAEKTDNGPAADPALSAEDERRLLRNALLPYLALPKTVAVGEIGLDYYWEKDPAARARQRRCFILQLELARETGLPVIIHSREAAEDTLQIAKEQDLGGSIRGVMHCWSYSPELAREYLRMGVYLGIGGVVTYKNGRKLKETVAEAPLERLLLETDCPYLSPVPYRGKRNCSLYLPEVVRAVAEIKGVTGEEVVRVTRENAEQLFLRPGPQKGKQPS